MKFGFIRAAAATPAVKPADCVYNTDSIIENMKEADKNSAELIVFPELCITGYTCGDLFGQKTLLESALEGLRRIKEASEHMNMVTVAGLPFEYSGKLYNCACVIFKGHIKALIPKTYLPNYNEFYEMRWFAEALKDTQHITVLGDDVPFGTDIIIESSAMSEFALSVELCEDLWSVMPPSSRHALAGAVIIANPSAGNEITGKDIYRKALVENQSARILGTYVYTCAGDGESTTDVVYSGHNLICENGVTLSEAKRFENGIIYADTDVSRLASERRKNTTFRTDKTGYETVTIDFTPNNCDIGRFIDPAPFVPDDINIRKKRCEEIINIQSHGLKKRMEHLNAKNVVLGVSGGLDSTQALIVCSKAFDLMGLDRKGIIAVTMPCFGTTDRTHNNAANLIKSIGAAHLEVNIKDAVLKHFEDIGHDPEVHDLTFENSQARQRTMVLMDIASEYNGFVVGTGDLSELALGWATYNGDHMSMYNVNCSIPKTLIKYLIEYFADTTKDETLRNVLTDILDTPISPELLPPDSKGEITQVTEDVVGPYELHDFFLYNMIRLGYSPDKIFYLAKIAFREKYDDAALYKWLRNFCRRFFAQQYKRSCVPDGPKVGSVSLSPRGDWRMPSDASVRIWLDILDRIKEENNF